MIQKTGADLFLQPWRLMAVTPAPETNDTRFGVSLFLQNVLWPYRSLSLLLL